MPEAWNLDRPEVVREIHRAYYAAGACAVLSNTFGANAARLGDSHSRHRVRELNRAGVLLAREVCPEGGLVAGDIGPSGLFLEQVRYPGDPEPDPIHPAVPVF